MAHEYELKFTQEPTQELKFCQQAPSSSTGGITGVGSVDVVTKIKTLVGADGSAIVTIGNSDIGDINNNTQQYGQWVKTNAIGVQNVLYLRAASSEAQTSQLYLSNTSNTAGQFRLESILGSIGSKILGEKELLNARLVDADDIDLSKLELTPTTAVLKTYQNTDLYDVAKVYLDTTGVSLSIQNSINPADSALFKVSNNDLLVSSPNITLGTVAQFITDGSGNIALRSISDGTTGQVLTTNGAGTISWTTVSGSSGITSLNTLTGATQTFVNDTNITIVSAGTTHTLTWAGTLADARIASAATWNAKQAALSGTGIVKSTAGTISYLTDNSTNWDTAYTNRITTANSPLSIASNAISIQVANTSQNGYLSSIDWNTFNGKGSGTVTSVIVTTANGVSGSVATSTTTPAITLTLGAITPTTVNGLTITTTTGTITVTNGTTITMPASTSTVLANNLGISGGTTLIGGTASGNILTFIATSNATTSSTTNSFVFKALSTEEILRFGNDSGGELIMFAQGNSNVSSNYFLRATSTVSYFNASSDLRLMIGTSNIIVCSSTTATMSQGITISDAKNIVLNTTTGTKIGTGTTQKLAFWNKTPIVQPTTGITGATLTGGGGTTITATDTFGGYTLQQIAAALINTGILA